MVVWLIGKSAAGKTAIGRALCTRLKASRPAIVFLDGDQLREAIGMDLGYSVIDRYESERRSSRLCKLLSDQGIDVICAKLSNAPEIRVWNRENLRDYREIYLRVSDEVLRQRDPKGIYKQFEAGATDQVVGKDILFHEPESPWLVIDNQGIDSVAEIVNRILHELSSS